MTSPDPNAVVVPLDGRDLTDPWQALARGDAMLATWSDGPASPDRAWGARLRPTSVLARQLADLAGRGGRTVGQGVRRFRLELPAGYGTDELVSAVGGGLRAAVAGPGGRIAGNARLVPVTWGRRLARHGPALGLMAVTIVAELVAGDEQQRTLDGIRSGVDRLVARLDLDEDAQLHTAEAAIRSAHAALLDGAAIPESIGLGTAMSTLQVIRARSAALLTGWERVVTALPDVSPASGAELRTALGDVGRLGWDAVPRAIGTAYLSLTLDSRRIMLSAAEAQLRNPGAPLTSFRETVAADLASRADELARLRRLLRRLSTVPLTTSGWALPHLVADGAAENARTQALFATLSAALDAADRPVHPPVVEAELAPDGAVKLLRTSRHDGVSTC